MNDEERLQILFKAAISSDPPLLTNNPQVNHMVDNHTTDSNVPYDENLYLEEIHAWKKTNGFLLTYQPSDPFVRS